ncbi:MAG TPA: winged helix-turn-helix domain-containing protein [Patescibacteria group bacterium]|nr:winged helix-turn-helix domain-containing protein [Patescibacteria group bacterium]
MEPLHFEELYPETTRNEEINKIVEILRTGRSCQVIGIPGSGKSNVLRLLAYNKKIRLKHLGDDQEIFHFIYMDFSEMRGRSLFDIIKFIFISLSYSLGERGFTKEQEAVNAALRESLEFSDELILFQGLKKSVDFLAIEHKLYLVFLFDRFEDYVPNIDERFFPDLKILRNRVKYNFLAVFAVTRPIEDTIEAPLFGDFYEFIVGNTIFLPIKDPVGLDFRFSYIEQITKSKGSPEARAEIEKLTGGHGKLAKLSYETYLAEEKIKNLEEFLLSKKQIRAALFEIWEYLTAEEKADIAGGAPNDFLEKVGLTNSNKLSVPLLASYVKTRPSTVASQKITYDSERNEINKGDENISDKLTPSEFRLLRYLIINVDRVAEKDEIIQNVWQDTKTQQGVTDQALDQIIYRLRKKIEEDPNKPVHIQTVKGRGYKFSS